MLHEKLALLLTAESDVVAVFLHEQAVPRERWPGREKSAALNFQDFWIEVPRDRQSQRAAQMLLSAGECLRHCKPSLTPPRVSFQATGPSRKDSPRPRAAAGRLRASRSKLLPRALKAGCRADKT